MGHYYSLTRLVAVESPSHGRLCDPMECGLPNSFSVHGISQAGILEWVAVSFFGGSS